MGGDIYSTVLAGDKTLVVQPLFVDHTFFEVFTFPLVRGDIGTALRDVNSVVVTESTAKKFFNTTDVLGRMMQIDADPSFERLGKPMIITAVCNRCLNGLETDCEHCYQYCNHTCKQEYPSPYRYLIREIL